MAQTFDKDDPFVKMLIADLLARHVSPTPSQEVLDAIPDNVVVPDDSFLTEKIQDPTYTPYCLRTIRCGRLHRTVYGFTCPNCKAKLNHNLTPYKG